MLDMERGFHRQHLVVALKNESPRLKRVPAQRSSPMAYVIAARKVLSFKP
jgi:hypothetical protein